MAQEPFSHCVLSKISRGKVKRSCIVNFAVKRRQPCGSAVHHKSSAGQFSEQSTVAGVHFCSSPGRCREKASQLHYCFPKIGCSIAPVGIACIALIFLTLLYKEAEGFFNAESNAVGGSSSHIVVLCIAAYPGLLLPFLCYIYWEFQDVLYITVYCEMLSSD